MSMIPGGTGTAASFPDGIIGSQRASVQTIVATLVLTSASNRLQLVTPSGATRTVQLPATGVLQGEEWILMNAAGSGQSLIVAASNGSTILTLAPGESGRVVASVAAPVASGDWQVQVQGITLADGSVSVPSLRFTGASGDTGLYSPGTDQIAFSQNGVQTLLSSAAGAFTLGPVASSPDVVTLFSSGTVRASGSVFLGRSAGDYGYAGYNARPGAANTWTYAVGDTASIIKFQNGGFSFRGTSVVGTAGNTITLIDFGNVTSSGVWTFGNTANTGLVQHAFENNGRCIQSIRGNSANAGAAMAELELINKNDSTGWIWSYTSDTVYGAPAFSLALTRGSTNRRARGWCDPNGAWTLGTASVTTAQHTAQGSTSDSSALRIRNHTNALRSDGITISLANGNAGSGTLGSTAFLRCFNDGAGETRNSTERMVIRTDGSVYNVTNTYGATSDIALKENIVDARSYTEDLALLRVVKYNRIDDPTNNHLGLIAQEVEAVFPSLVEGQDGSKGVKYSVINLMMLKTIQELSAKANALEARLLTLESV